ncbi:probable helicase with zinc finger domain [Bombus affinis]|uniref:probable helicase with zinc finger domain n=1 Tax=Bombus affinis TaxID=309941 RepID=UPI0021B7919D|nr:probable helicase with zinc finger domain [Bombus affinis]XP_050588485.1 probable helicase with zinc finger domain [Bombus affinis]
MVDHLYRMNGEVKTHFPSGFAEKVQHDWVKSQNPETIITCKDTDGVLIFSNKSLCCRSTINNIVFCWKFEVVTNGKQLQRIALTLDQNRKNFSLKSVIHRDINIGTTNGQEWYNSELDNSNVNENVLKEEHYVVKICFNANKYGTYRQNIIFYFGEYPVIIQKICMDSMPKKDFTRIHEATNYQFSQNPNIWNNKTCQICRFDSPFVSMIDPEEDILSRMYSYPDRSNFFLTQESLTDDRLTPENYRGRLHELITVEELARHEQIARYNETTYMHFLSYYALTSSDGSTTVKYAPPGELFAQLPLSRSISEDTKCGRLFLRGCNRVLFMSLTQLTNVIYEAHIEDKCTHTVYIRLSKECVHALNLAANTDLHVQVQFLLNRLPFCEWHRSVDSLPDIGLVFLNNAHKNMEESSFPNLLDTNESKVEVSLLNVEQEKALAVITASTNISMPPILLLGPFGTGKTFTIAQALRFLLTKNSEYKILLCTHSNSAADLYVKEFFDVWYKCENNPRLKPVRIYYKGRSRNTVHPVVQEYSLMKQNCTFRNPTEEDLKDCGLIVTTLATSSSLTSLNLSFTHIVIDEAAQALECEVLIPLALATPQTRLVLAGDQMQLAPEIYSDLASERGLGISLLERIHEMYPQTHPCRIHLHQNYRAHRDIINFTSEMFYDGIVKSASQKDHIDIIQHPTLKPLTFYAVEGVEIQDIHSTGYANMGEVFELVNRVQDLRNNWPTDRWGIYGEKSIGVLVYYAEQVQRIRVELRERRMTDVSVERVLNAQGKQFTAVFISTVRTRHCCRYSAERNVKDYGFLTNPRLLNTAMTRAKCLVAVVGDPVALFTIGSCRRLWQRYLEISDLHGIDRETLNRLLRLVPKLSFTPLNPLAREFVPRNSVCLVEYVSVPVLYPVFHYPFYSA